MRLFILTLSMGCVILYGYALAGYGGFFFGRGRADYIAWGLTLGTLCGGLALYLWKKYGHLYYVESDAFAENDQESEAKTEEAKERRVGQKDQKEN